MGDETTVALNRRARHDFTIDETFEAGIVLTGTEIKSLRAGKANLSNAYARIDRGEAWLVGADIAPFEGGIATTTSRNGPVSSSCIAPRSTSCWARPRRRARRSSRCGSTSTRRAGPRSNSGSPEANSSTTVAATSPIETRNATSPANWPTPSGAGRAAMEGTGCLRWIGLGVFSVVVVGLAVLRSGLLIGDLLIASCGC